MKAFWQDLRTHRVWLDHKQNWIESTRPSFQTNLEHSLPANWAGQKGVGSKSLKHNHWHHTICEPRSKKDTVSLYFTKCLRQFSTVFLWFLLRFVWVSDPICSKFHSEHLGMFFLGGFHSSTRETHPQQNKATASSTSLVYQASQSVSEAVAPPLLVLLGEIMSKTLNLPKKNWELFHFWNRLCKLVDPIFALTRMERFDSAQWWNSLSLVKAMA